MMSKHPKYYRNTGIKAYLDYLATHKALDQAADDGLTIQEISKITDIGYARARQATVRLRKNRRVDYERQGHTLRFWARP